MQAAPSSARASKPPMRLPKAKMSKLSPVASVKSLVKSIARPPSTLTLDLQRIHGRVQSPHFVQELSHSAVNAFNLLEYCG